MTEEATRHAAPIGGSAIPLHLAAPRTEGVRLHGRVFAEGLPEQYVVEAEPAVLEVVKRVFPGSVAKRGVVRFAATRRAAEDLNWVLTRYPMQVECGELFARGRAEAIEHAARREGGAVLAPVGNPSGFNGELYGFQQEGAAFFAANERALLADDMGLGKTVTALGTVAHLGLRKVLVVCPPNLVRQWCRQAQAFLRVTVDGEMLERPPECLVLRGRKPRDVEASAITVTHYLLLTSWREWIVEQGFDAVVFDEIQELRRQESDKYSAASIIAGRVGRVFGLSGTPIYNYGEEIWSVMNIIDHLCLGCKEAFLREWCTPHGAHWKIREPQALGDYMRREGMMLRRRKADVQSELPAKRRVVSVIDHDEDVYAELVRQAVAIARGLDAVKEWRARGEAIRTIEAETRRATGVAKAPYVAAFVKTLVQAGERVLLFAYHHDVYDALTLGLGSAARVVEITGRESQSQKESAVVRFASGEADVALMSLRTSAGLDGLQQAGTCVVFAELDWSPAIHSQCEDRLHRQGLASKESLLCYYMVAETGMDEAIRECLGVKVEQFTGLMGDVPAKVEESDEVMLAMKRQMDRVIERLKGGG